MDGGNEFRNLVHKLSKDLAFLRKSDAFCCGVSSAQYRVIVEIGRNKEISLNELANALGLDKSTMSRTIRNLVESNFVSQKTDQRNKRYVIIQLTDHGASVYRTIEENVMAYYQNVFSKIPKEQRGQILKSLQILNEVIEQNQCC